MVKRLNGSAVNVLVSVVPSVRRNVAVIAAAFVPGWRSG
jgi:hypothetical protein